MEIFGIMAAVAILYWFVLLVLEGVGMKWGCIGASNIAHEWVIPAIRGVGDEIVGVSSTTAARAAEFAKENAIPNFTTQIADFAKYGVEAVYISNTNEKHEAAVLFAAQQGWHVLCEKPITTNLASANNMIAACQKAGVVFVTNHHLRHNQAHAIMRTMVREQTLGKLVSARVHHSVYLKAILQGWRLQNKDAGGGVVLDIAVHNADSMAYILGEYPFEVTAITNNSGMAVGLEDTAMSLWRYPSGLTVFTHQGFSTPYAPVSLELHGTEGSVCAPNALVHKLTQSQMQHTSAKGTETIPLVLHNVYEVCIQEFHKAVQGKANNCADGKAGAHSLAVALAILESAQSKKTIAVRYI